MPRVSKDPKIRKQEILEAAMLVFYEKGYDKTNMADIAKKVGVAQGLCYRYFPSKEALFNTSLQVYAQTIADRLKPFLADRSLTLKQKLEQIPSYVDYEQDGSPYYKAFHNENEESKKIHDQLSLKVCELVTPLAADTIKLAHEKGEVDIVDYEAAASFCIYGQLGLLLNGALDEQEKVRRIRDQINHFFRF
ncbi:MAG: TetR/AcrR family transcriptional regulator [Thermotaleaceae bacterium]